ncbi:hypothetical protein [Maricaulis sp.]|uniref:hypothetical protein n=1 Tax=Maricaulis sp. TaxID=1486257 RepID=UPI003A92C341
MIVNFEFEPDNRLCVYRISGQVTADALMDAFADARSNDGWSDDFNALTLLQNASLSTMPAEAMTELRTRMAAVNPVTDKPTRRAAIVCADKLSKAMLTYWEIITAGRLTPQQRIFQTEAEARAWLCEPV